MSVSTCEFVFISCANKDQGLVDKVVHALEERGVSTWTAHNIRPGTPMWETTIREKLASCRAVLVACSPNAVASRFVQAEIEIAQNSEKKRRIIAVWIDGQVWADSAPLSVIATHRVDCRGANFARGINQLANEIGIDPPSVEIEVETDVFICNDDEDFQVVQEISVAMKRLGIDCLTVHNKTARQELRRVGYIDTAIDSCRLVIFVWSHHVNRNSKLQREIAYAERTKKNILIIRLDDSPIPTEFLSILSNADEIYAEPAHLDEYINSITGRVRSHLMPLMDHVQLPDLQVADGLGEVNVRRVNDKLEIIFTMMPKPLPQVERTGVALDASRSMTGIYGQNVIMSAEDFVKYGRAGKIEEIKTDNRVEKRVTGDKKRFENTRNIVREEASRFIGFMSRHIAKQGKTTVVYWACGIDGTEFEVVGDLTADGCMGFEFNGPTSTTFGDKTCLAPVIRYFLDHCHHHEQGRFVIITDGRIQDQKDLRELTNKVSKQVLSGERNPIKFVLIGIGHDLDREYMQELDNMIFENGVDLWDHKIVSELKDVRKVLAEPLYPREIVEESYARILDEDGNVVKEFNAGLPAEVSFQMPSTSNEFRLEIDGARDIVQRIDIDLPDTQLERQKIARTMTPPIARKSY